MEAQFKLRKHTFPYVINFFENNFIFSTITYLIKYNFDLYISKTINTYSYFTFLNITEIQVKIQVERPNLLCSYKVAQYGRKVLNKTLNNAAYVPQYFIVTKSKLNLTYFDAIQINFNSVHKLNYS